MPKSTELVDRLEIVCCRLEETANSLEKMEARLYSIENRMGRLEGLFNLLDKRVEAIEDKV